MDENGSPGAESGETTRAQYAGEGAGAVDWEAIKHAVIYSGLSLRRIADTYGSSEKTIGDRARKHGWVRLVPVKQLPRGRRARLPGAPRPPRATADQVRRRALALRLFRVIDAKLKEIETRMQKADANAAPPSAADTERDVRGVTTLMTLYAKLVELDKQSRNEKRDAGGDQNADQLRRELLLRLERFNRQGDA